jgi:hypothetical protein
MNYWYVARSNELFIDTDNVSKSIKHTRARLQGAIESNKLNVAYVISMQSTSPNHLHTIITLKGPISYAERYAWEIILHGDIYRSACNLMRSVHNVPAPDVLISPHIRFEGNYQSRPADFQCECVQKHTAAVMNMCNVAIALRGEHRTRGFFGKPSKNPCKIWDVTL